MATDAGGMREILAGHPEAGGLFDGDAEALARALAAVIEEPREAAACRARAEAFSLEATVEAYAALYAEVRAA